MNTGIKVAWQALNPNSKAVRFGVIAQQDDDKPGNVLILVGANTLTDDDYSNPNRPSGGYDVISLSEKQLTIVP